MTTQFGNNRGSDDGGEFQEKVVHIRRVAKVVKGGRNLTFNAMVVVGDGHGSVGAGLGKGAAVPDAVRKGNTIARKNMVLVPLKGSTIPHAVTAKYDASVVLMRPGAAGSGVKAGGAVRAVLEAVGIRDIVAKALGSRNPINVVKATLAGLQKLQGGEAVEAANVATLPPLTPERRGPMRREGGGGFRGRDRDRGDRRPSSGPPRGPRPERDDAPRPARDVPPRAEAPADRPAPNGPAADTEVRPVPEAQPARPEAQTEAETNG
ncbi:MAG: 30S ribosomal protein S5 [Dehalococcoidia bacterium]